MICAIQGWRNFAVLSEFLTLTIYSSKKKQQTVWDFLIVHHVSTVLEFFSFLQSYRFKKNKTKYLEIIKITNNGDLDWYAKTSN